MLEIKERKNYIQLNSKTGVLGMRQTKNAALFQGLSSKSECWDTAFPGYSIATEHVVLLTEINYFVSV